MPSQKCGHPREADSRSLASLRLTQNLEQDVPPDTGHTQTTASNWIDSIVGLGRAHQEKGEENGLQLFTFGKFVT